MVEGFEWDDAKRQANIAKHGVDFRTAVEIFQNQTKEHEDTREGYSEQRFQVLGHVGDEHFIVVYTWCGTTRRIISAWKAGEQWQRRTSGNTQWTTSK